ncbi:MAG: gliding motility-associated protein GldE [Bacteroidetes bacterium]|nr:gliding motility-associated protein GldE [Bacteroidota bacterium]
MDTHSRAELVVQLSVIIRPFDFSIVFQLLSILILLVCSSLFSGSEVAFFSLRSEQLEGMRNGNHKRAAGILTNLLAQPNKLIATLLIANNFVNIAIVILSSIVLESIFDFTTNPLLGTIIEIGVVTFIIIMFGEVLPKVYATRKSEFIAAQMAFPIYAVSKLLSPISFALTSATNMIEKNVKAQNYSITIDELNHAIDIASDQSTPIEEKKILKGIVKFGNIDVTQIMRTRPDLVAFEFDTKFIELLKKIIESGYSRVPVYDESIDNIKGILHIKDLLAHINEGDDFDWHKLMREPFFVPESKKINDLLEDFQERKTHFAVIVDEYGGVSGIVTLEDVLEEIVGELNDEFDDEEPNYSKLDEHNFVFEAKIMLMDVSRIMQIELSLLEPHESEAVTLAGLILELAGKIPQKNDVIRYGNISFTIEAADRRKIKRVKVSRKV